MELWLASNRMAKVMGVTFDWARLHGKGGSMPLHGSITLYKNLS